MINFRSFCSNEDMRPYLSEPFSFGGCTYATNGHIAVRVPRSDQVPEAREAQQKSAATLDKLLAARLGVQVPRTFERQLPEEQEGDDCERCEATGKGHPDCPDCGCDCDDCEGTGTFKPRQRIRFETFDVNVKYLRLVVGLPDAKICLGVAQADWPLLFTFDGGAGLLMPMMQHADKDDEIHKFTDLAVSDLIAVNPAALERAESA